MVSASVFIMFLSLTCFCAPIFMLSILCVFVLEVPSLIFCFKIFGSELECRCRVIRREGFLQDVLFYWIVSADRLRMQWDGYG